MNTSLITLKINRTISATLCFLLIPSAFSQDIEPVKGYYDDNFVFSSGYWVYQDTINADIDSITLLGCFHDYLPPTPIIPDYREYYMINYYSHTYYISYNDYFITQYWKRNGGGPYGELGQLLMGIGQYINWPEVGTSYGGFEIIDILDTIEVNGNMFYDVVVSRIYEDQQTQNEFEYTTDLYFAPQVGIIKKTYTDSLNQNHSWNLMNWQVEISAVNEILPTNNEVVIYPNPTRGVLTVRSKGIENIELLDVRGKSIKKLECNSDESAVDLENILPGLYLIKVITGNDAIYKTIIIE